MTSCTHELIWRHHNMWRHHMEGAVARQFWRFYAIHVCLYTYFRFKLHMLLHAPWFAICLRSAGPIGGLTYAYCILPCWFSAQNTTLYRPYTKPANLDLKTANINSKKRYRLSLQRCMSHELSVLKKQKFRFPDEKPTWPYNRRWQCYNEIRLSKGHEMWRKLEILGSPQLNKGYGIWR